MDFAYTPAEQAFRAELRAWLAANVPREAIPLTLDEEAAYLTRWQRTLYEIAPVQTRFVQAGWNIP